MIRRIPTILVDTREQSPWSFGSRAHRIKHTALKVGDYSVLGMQNIVTVERKSVPDLFHTMTRGLARFEKELDKVERTGMRFMAVIVEGSFESISLGSRWSWAQPDRVLSTFYQVCLKRGIAPYVCDGRAEAEKVAWHLLYNCWLSKPRRIIGQGGGGGS